MEREIYPNAPIVLVACEIRYPSAGEASPRELRDLRDAFRDWLPLYKPLESQTVEVVNGVPQSVQREMSPRYVSRDRTQAVTVGPERAVVETTSYAGYEALQVAIERTVAAVADIRSPDGIERIGLRYIDELRVPLEDDGVANWEHWVADDLLGPIGRGESFDMAAKEWQGLVRFDGGKGRSLVLRYGPRVGFAVEPAQPLRRKAAGAAPGDFFLLDFDSFWESGDEVPEFTLDGVTHRCNALHKPIHGLFESLITDRCREEVLRHA